MFNHVIIVGRVHKTQDNLYRVVGFEVKPRSIASNRYTITSTESTSCSVKSSAGDIGGALLLDSKSMKPDDTLGIVWSYTVQWEESDIAWASRWDTYLHMDDAEIHWFSIINSLITVLFLTGVMVRFPRVRCLFRLRLSSFASALKLPGLTQYLLRHLSWFGPFGGTLPSTTRRMPKMHLSRRAGNLYTVMSSDHRRI